MKTFRFLEDLVRADWSRPSVVTLVLANLVPVFGVLVLGWETFPLLFLFWAENLIIGAFNVLKMFLASPGSVWSWAGKLLYIPFFCCHYGIFTYGHGFFLIWAFGGGMKGDAVWPGPADFWQFAQDYHCGWALLALAVSHAVSFATNYVSSGEYKRAEVTQLMGQPYSRVIVMQITIVAGAMAMDKFHSPPVALLVLVALKIVMDLAGHLRERRKFAGELPPSEGPLD